MLRQESQVCQKSAWILDSIRWQKKDTNKSTVNFQCMAWMHRMRTLQADFVDVTVYGPTIKLSGTDLRRSFRPADRRQERARRIERGQKLNHASRERIAAGFFKKMRDTLVPDAPFDPKRLASEEGGGIQPQATRHSPLQINRLARGTQKAASSKRPLLRFSGNRQRKHCQRLRSTGRQTGKRCG